MHSPGLLIASLFVGFLIGLTGIGGAALMAPFLILGLHVRPIFAVGTDLVYATVTKILGAYVHWKQGTVDLKVAFRLATASVPGGMLGVLVASHLPSLGLDSDKALRTALGFALVLVAATLLICTVRPVVVRQPMRFLERHEKLATLVWGGIVGFIVGLTSIGSGSLIAPLLLLLYPGFPARVVGTDIFHAAMLGAAAAFLHAQAGNVDWDLVPMMLAGSIPGVLIGSYIAPRIPARALRVALSMVLLGTGVRLI